MRQASKDVHQHPKTELTPGILPKENASTYSWSSYAKAAALVVASTAAYCVVKVSGWSPWSWWKGLEEKSNVALTTPENLSLLQSAVSENMILDNLPTSLENTFPERRVEFQERFLPSVENVREVNDGLMPRESKIGRKLLGIGDEFGVANTLTGPLTGSRSVAALSDGSFVVVWTEYDAAGTYARRYDAGGDPIGFSFRVNTVTSFSLYSSIAALSDGGFVVTWEGPGQETSQTKIHARRYDAAGNPTSVEFPVNTLAANFGAIPSVTALLNGDFVVMWTGRGGLLDTLFGQRYNAGGNAVGGQFQVNTSARVFHGLHAVAGLPDGGFVVTWETIAQDGNSDGIYGQRYDNAGNVVGSEFRVNTLTITSQGTPAVVGLPGGGFLVVWSDAVSADIYGKHYDGAGNIFREEFRINTLTSGFQDSPSVAALSGGGFVVTWEGPGQGDGDDIYGQRYNATSNSVGGQFRINSFSTDFDSNPSVAGLLGGNFITTWRSFFQDGSSRGIYGRILDEAFFAPTILLFDGSRSYTKNSPPSLVAVELFLIDVDSTTLESAQVNIANVQFSDELLFTDQLGITGSYNSTAGFLTLSGSSTLANYQTALRSVSFRNTLENADMTPRIINITVNDGILSSTSVTCIMKVVEIVITPSNTTSSYTENGSPTAVDSGLILSDADDIILQSAQMSITNLQPGDELLFTDQLGITGSYNSATGVLTLSGSSALTNYQTALRSVSFHNTSKDPKTSRNINIFVNDGNANSASVTRTINIVTINDAPTVITTASVAAYAGNLQTVPIDPTLSVSDVDNVELQSAIVSIGSGFKTGQDFLFFGNQNNIAGVYDASTGVLSMTGSASVLNYQTALRSVAYHNSENNPDRSTRRVLFTVSDGNASSVVSQRDIVFSAIPDTPSTLDKVKENLTLGIPSGIAGVGLTAFGIWAYRRQIDKSWKACPQYAVHDYVRKNLKLNVGTVEEARNKGYLPVVFKLIGEMLSLFREVNEADTDYYERLAERVKTFSSAEVNYYGDILLQAVKAKIDFQPLCGSLADGTRPVIHRKRYVKDCFPNPTPFFVSYKLDPDLFTVKLIAGIGEIARQSLNKKSEEAVEMSRLSAV